MSDKQRLYNLLATSADNYGRQVEKYHKLRDAYRRTDYELTQAKRHPIRFALRQLYINLHDLLSPEKYEY